MVDDKFGSVSHVEYTIYGYSGAFNYFNGC